MTRLLATFSVTAAVLAAGWAGLAQTQETGMARQEEGAQMAEGAPKEMMARCRMTMGAELSPRDPAVLLGMTDDLQLTDQQVAQLRALAEEARKKAAVLLTDAQRRELEQLPAQPQSMMQMHRRMMGRMGEMEGGMGRMGDMDMCSMMMRMMGGMQEGEGMKCPMCGMEMGQDGDASADPPAAQVDLDAEAQAQIDRLVSSYLTIQRRLAQDEMQGVAAQLDAIEGAARRMAQADGPEFQQAVEAVAVAAEAEPKDLERARAAFKDVSAAVIKVVQMAPPSDPAAAALYVANCPMAGADWLQDSKQVTENPYMGQRMPRCGSVKQTLKAPSTGG